MLPRSTWPRTEFWIKFRATMRVVNKYSDLWSTQAMDICDLGKIAGWRWGCSKLGWGNEYRLEISFPFFPELLARTPGTFALETLFPFFPSIVPVFSHYLYKSPDLTLLLTLSGPHQRVFPLLLHLLYIPSLLFDTSRLFLLPRFSHRSPPSNSELP